MTDSQNSPEPRGLQFPGTFEISVMGAADAGLDAVLVAVLDALGLPAQRQTLRQRPSSRGNYVSVTIAYEAQSRDDYDALYGALRARPEVKYIL